MSGFMLQRLGLIIEPEPGNPQEIEGILNPAAIRGPDGALYAWGVVITPALGAVLMSVSTVIVAINARMLGMKKKPNS